VLLLGSDQYAAFDTWHRPDLVRARCRIAVAERPGSPLPSGDYEAVALDPVDVSSSEVRRRVAAGASIDGLVTPSVAALIRAEGLYR
jgi:nicotinate-nucleotide adenylyltransferase